MNIFFSVIYSQSLWVSAESKYKFTKDLGVSIEAEYRTSDKFKSTDRWTGGLNIDYKIIRYIKVDAGYKFIYKHFEEEITGKGNVIDSYWQPRQRFHISASGLFKWRRFTLSLRERYQFTHHKSMSVRKTGPSGQIKDDEYIRKKNKQVLRSRLKLEYSFRKSGFTPYISAETYTGLENFNYVKTRLTAGTSYQINRHNTIEAFYRYIDKHDGDDAGNNIIGLSYQFKF